MPKIRGGSLAVGTYLQRGSAPTPPPLPGTPGTGGKGRQKSSARQESSAGAPRYSAPRFMEVGFSRRWFLITGTEGQACEPFLFLLCRMFLSFLKLVLLMKCQGESIVEARFFTSVKYGQQTCLVCVGNL